MEVRVCESAHPTPIIVLVHVRKGQRKTTGRYVPSSDSDLGGLRCKKDWAKAATIRIVTKTKEEMGPKI